MKGDANVIFIQIYDDNIIGSTYLPFCAIFSCFSNRAFLKTSGVPETNAFALFHRVTAGLQVLSGDGMPRDLISLDIILLGVCRRSGILG